MHVIGVIQHVWVTGEDDLISTDRALLFSGVSRLSYFIIILRRCIGRLFPVILFVIIGKVSQKMNMAGCRLRQ